MPLLEYAGEQQDQKEQQAQYTAGEGKGQQGGQPLAQQAQAEENSELAQKIQVGSPRISYGGTAVRTARRRALCAQPVIPRPRRGRRNPFLF